MAEYDLSIRERTLLQLGGKDVVHAALARLVGWLNRQRMSKAEGMLDTYHSEDGIVLPTAVWQELCQELGVE